MVVVAALAVNLRGVFNHSPHIIVRTLDVLGHCIANHLALVVIAQVVVAIALVDIGSFERPVRALELRLGIHIELDFIIRKLAEFKQIEVVAIATATATATAERHIRLAIFIDENSWVKAPRNAIATRHATATNEEFAHRIMVRTGHILRRHNANATCTVRINQVKYAINNGNTRRPNVLDVRNFAIMAKHHAMVRPVFHILGTENVKRTNRIVVFTRIRAFIVSIC